MNSTLEVAIESPDHVSQDRETNLRVDSLAHGVLLLIGLTAAQRVVGLVRNVLFCRLLQPDELGLFNLAYSVLVIASPLAVLGLPGSFGRYVEYYRQRQQLRTFVRRAAILSTLLCASFVAVMCWNRTWATWLAFGDVEQVPLLVSTAVALLAVTSFNFLTELLTALRQVRAVSRMQFVNSVLFALVGLTFLHWSSWRAEGVVLAYAAACLASSVVVIGPLRGIWRSLGSQQEELPHKELWSRIVPFAAWVWVSNLWTNMFHVSDRYMIVHYSGRSAVEAAALVGQYHSSRVVPDLFIALAALLGSFMLPYLSHDWEQGHREEVARKIHLTVRLFALAMTLGGVLVLWTAPLLFEVALGGKYHAGQAVLPWTLMYCVWFGLTVLAQNYLWCAEKASLGSVCLLVGLLANIGLNLLLLPRLGLLGVVLATALAHLLTLCLVQLLSHRLGWRWSWRTVALALLPASLGLGCYPATAVVLLTLAITCSTNWLFTAAEKQAFAAFVIPYLKFR